MSYFLYNIAWIFSTSIVNIGQNTADTKIFWSNVGFILQREWSRYLRQLRKHLYHTNIDKYMLRHHFKYVIDYGDFEPELFLYRLKTLRNLPLWKVFMISVRLSVCLCTNLNKYTCITTKLIYVIESYCGIFPH